MLSKAETTCVLCSTNEHASVLYPGNVHEVHLNPTIFSARRTPDRVHATILKCSKCRLVYPTELIDPAKLSSLYEQSKYTYAEEEYFIRRTYQRYLRQMLPVLKDQRRPWSYLDVGCGNGFMLAAAREVGFDHVWGVEPSRHAIAQAEPGTRPHLIQGMFSRELISGKRFDAISVFQTLDHIPDPVAFVNDCSACLKPGGAVLFINHNIESWTARILGERCPMIDIEHTYLHTPSTMRQLFDRAGFADISVFGVRNDYPLHYWAHLLPGPKWLKSVVQAFLRRTFLSGVVLPLYAGNLGLIARRPLEAAGAASSDQAA
jgi:SAM-dependent methyltransferase